MADAFNLYQRHTIEELQEKIKAIQGDPRNREPKGSLYLYKPGARRRLDALGWAITYHLQDKRRAEEGAKYGS